MKFSTKTSSTLTKEEEEVVKTIKIVPDLSSKHLTSREALFLKPHLKLSFSQPLQFDELHSNKRSKTLMTVENPLSSNGTLTGTASLFTIWQEGSIEFARLILDVAKKEDVELLRQWMGGYQDGIKTSLRQVKNV